jgi:polyisoprenoid-binding protein YceI
MSSTTPLTRRVGGSELPAAGTWKVDPGHAEVGSVGRHFMLTRVRGRFTDVDATVQIGERPADSRIDWDGHAGTVTGDLTIAGITRPVTLAVTFLGAVVDPWDNDRAVFEAHGRIDRGDWGLTWNMVLDSGGLLVSREIDLELHVELIRQ